MSAGSAVHNHIAGAAVEVTGDEHRDFIVILETFDFFADILGDSAAQQEATGFQVNFFQSFNSCLCGFICRTVEEEQLTDFIVQAHAFDGFFYPGDLFIVQIERFCAQIDS